MKAIAVSDESFESEVLKSPLPVLVDFWAEWCAPCKMISTIVEEIAGEFDGKLRVTKIDVDSNQSTAIKYNVHSIPNLLLFKNGKVVDQVIGFVPKKALADRITKHLS